jgi:hypothetical protein
MTLILRKQRAQDRIEGQDTFDWGEGDYAVVDETQVYDTQIGRIYKERVPAGVKWLWFLQVVEAPLPNKGIADTLDEAEAALAKRYEEVKRGEMIGRNARTAEWRRHLKGHVLSPEQRQALVLLTRNPRGATKARLLADGLTVDMLADLIREGLVTAEPGSSRVGGREIRVERYRITDDGRDALAAES